MKYFAPVLVLVLALSCLPLKNLNAQKIVNGPGKLLFNTDKGFNEHLKVVSASELGENDVWQFEEVEAGNVIIKCPTRGYLKAGMTHDNIYELGYHQNASTASRFTPQVRADGYSTYLWVSNKPPHYIGDWRNKMVLKKGAPSAAHLKVENTKETKGIEGAFSNGETEWLFTETGESQTYNFTAYNTGKKYAVGFAYFSIKHNSFVVNFKVIGDDDNIGYVVCELEGDVINAKTLNPDGTERWTGRLTKNK